MQTQNLSIRARDGLELAGTSFGDPSSDSVAVINSATAVPRGFYRHFAGALATAGYRVITYDYRGIGGSRPATLRGFPAAMRDWALLDMAGVLDWVAAEHPQARVVLVGHSVGGQIAGLVGGAHNIAGMATMSSQSGYWKLQGAEQKLLVAMHVHLTFPVLTSIFGYLPWRKFGSSEDLPHGVAKEWARWCRDPKYLLGDTSLPLERYQQFAAPVLAYSFSDDKWGTSRSVDAMMSAYPNLQRQHVEPHLAGLEALAHFGYFRPAASTLWPDVIEWLDACPMRSAPAAVRDL